MEKKLSAFNVGDRGIIKSIAGEGNASSRLFDMGVSAGAEVVLWKKARLGVHLEIHIRGY